MAEGKKSFIMYCEWQELFNDLTDEQCGKLMKHIFAYVNDENPEAPDAITRIAFIQIKQQFKRDLKKYEAIAERNKLNGSKGGRPKTQNNPVGSLETQPNPENPIKDKGKGIKEKGEMIKEEQKENSSANKNLLVIEKNQDDENSFQIWWDLYAKKVDQKKCFARWKKYNHDTRVEIWRHTKKYIEATPDKQFRRNPLTYLNGENWKDTELLEAKKTHTGPTNGKVPVNDYLDNLLSGGQTEQKQIQ